MENKLGDMKSLSLSIMLCSFSFGILSFLLPIYSKYIGASALAIGGLFSIFSIVMLVIRPIVGKTIDRHGRKLFLGVGFFSYALSMFFFSYSTSVMLLYVGRIFQAMGSSFMWTSAYTIAMDMSESEEKGRAIGQVDGANAQGSLYGALMGFVLLSYRPFTFMQRWSILFKTYAVLAILAGVIALKDIPETKNFKRREEEYKIDSSFSSEFFRLMGIVFVGTVATSMLSPLLMVYLQDRFTTDIGTLGLAFIPAALVYAFLPSRLGQVSDKLGRRIPMIIGLVGSGIVSISFVYISKIELLIIFWVLESICIVMASPAETAYVSEIVGENILGYGYGIYLFVGSLGASIGPLLGGWLYDSFGYFVPFYLNGAILLLDAVLVYILFKGDSK